MSLSENSKVAKGDDYFAENNIESAQLIKIDVEGSGKSVLSGLNNTPTNLRPVIVREVTYGGHQSFLEPGGIRHTLPDDYLDLSIQHLKTQWKNRAARYAKTHGCL